MNLWEVFLLFEAVSAERGYYYYCSIFSILVNELFLLIYIFVPKLVFDFLIAVNNRDR